MTKKEIMEEIDKLVEKFPEGRSFLFGYNAGTELIRAHSGDLRDVIFLCEQIKLDAFNKQAKGENSLA